MGCAQAQRWCRGMLFLQQQSKCGEAGNGPKTGRFCAAPRILIDPQMTKADLIVALSAAREGSKVLDLEVTRFNTGCDWRWVGGRVGGSVTYNRYGPDAVGNPVCGLEAFTTSIDDAMELIHGDMYLIALGQLNPTTWYADVGHRGDDGIAHRGEGRNAALALCVAALYAQPEKVLETLEPF